MQNEILDLLMDADDYVSGQKISRRLGVSRQSVWKAVNSLKEKGYEINSVTNRGYRLAAFPNFLDESAVKRELSAKIIGKNLIVLDEIGSTNDYLKALGAKGCENGTVVAAREQTHGKGRLGRVWRVKKDDSLTFSFLLRPKITPRQVAVITPLAGLAVCKALREFTGLDCKIKWPNDIIVGSKKLVGILTEMSAEFDAVEYVVSGIGVNTDADNFPDEIAAKATSIYLETGKKPDKNALLARVLESIENEFSKSNLRLAGGALAEYQKLCVTIGREIKFFYDGATTTATALSVNESGELLARLADGSEKAINSGEVTVQGIY